MNWNKVKTILIAVFIFTDIFLAISIIVKDKKATRLEPEVKAAAVSLLSNNDISVKEELLKDRFSVLPIIQGTNIISDYDDFSKKILGEATIFSDNIYTSPIGIVSFSNDSFFINIKRYKYGFIADKHNAIKETKSFLQNNGFDISDSKITIENTDTKNIRVKVVDYYKSVPILVSTLTLNFSDDSFTISGSWFNKDTSLSSGNTSLKSISGTLVDFSSLYDGAKPCEINKCEIGLTILGNEAYHKAATLIPVHSIVVSSNGENKEYFIDARSIN